MTIPTRTDRGSSVLLVMACMTALALFATVALNVSVGSLKVADRQTSWNQALSAAEAGVADYLARLNKDDVYWQKVDCTNPALNGPSATGCNKKSAPGWQRVIGMDDAWFHYDVSTTTTLTTGAVHVKSTGKVGDITRTVDVRLRRGGFGEFLYYTVYETIDPADERVYGVNNTTAATYCTRYNWQTGLTSGSSSSLSSWSNKTRRPTDASGYDYCPQITFATGDVINGPMHTNDAFVVSGTPRFKGTTTTSDPKCRPSEAGAVPATSCYINGGSAKPTFDRGVAYRAEVELPTTIGDLKQYVTASSTNTSPGCLFTGPTRIKFLPATSASATQQMRVWSKYTTSADLSSSKCGTIGTSGSNKLGTSDGQLLNVPPDNLIMVQDVPSSRNSPTASACKTTGGIGDGLPLAGTSGNYPDVDINLNLAESSCRYGTAWIEGTFKGRLTIATDNNVIVTNNLLYYGGRTGTDSLGLIAKNSVRIYHPVKCSSKNDNGTCTGYSNLSGTMTNVEVQAAILTLQHSFSVQQYHFSKLGTLTLFGSFAQRFRGPVGTGSNGNISTGYLKNYTYDTRLRYAPPPYFLDPVRSGWGQKTFGEISPLYD